MKKNILLFGILGLMSNGYAQNNKPKSKTEKVVIEYKDKSVKGKQLTVSSEIPMDLDSAWANVKTPALLEFVAKGMIRFKTIESEFPKKWEVGQTYGVKMRIFGFIPFGGTHYLFIEKIDDNNNTISTKEWDKGAKVWNHDVTMKDLGNGIIHYEDSITIYGGVMTRFITAFAKRFYVHRQKRWQIVAKEKLNFTE
ncbi:hypothetical protein [Cecembia lonarensis]|uniref:DUF4468 domain-containing protein n=1 Tax=Cecembia lonarensis (strain CCUG 58316 / KCTC 22772 / LW9) TaxID=1225176 RepID=K1LG91_CECL9|nr:hypothetical protein [Cecembia lonarensis]EKB51197.1 hypothetical protein B879_00248 [Cecembia lonarensis LW9]